MNVDTRLSDLEERVQNLELRHGVRSTDDKVDTASERKETKLRTFPEVFLYVHSFINLFNQ